MRLLAAALLLVILTGCMTTLDICPENLNLTKSIPYQQIPDLGSYAHVYTTSLSQGGEVHDLDVYSSGETYYVEYEPAHFSNKRVYGPFNGSWRDDMACGP